jgi:hypothetical protein
MMDWTDGLGFARILNNLRVRRSACSSFVAARTAFLWVPKSPAYQASSTLHMFGARTSQVSGVCRLLIRDDRYGRVREFNSEWVGRIRP